MALSMNLDSTTQYVPRLLWGGIRRLLNALQYISWVSDSKLAWTLLAAGVGPDPLVEISARPISQEPMVRFMCLMQRG